MGLFFLTCSWSLQYLIQNHSCGVNVISLKQLFTNVYFALYDGMHFHFEQLFGHVFELGSLDIF
jgi:hypothetical protein